MLAQSILCHIGVTLSNKYTHRYRQDVTLLINAATIGHVEILTEFIAAGANVNATDSKVSVRAQYFASNQMDCC